MSATAILDKPVIDHDEPAPDAGVRPYRWTVDEFFAAIEKGAFKNPERLELLDGEVIERVAAQGIPHFDSVRAVASMVARAFGNQCEVRQQGRWTIGEYDYVEPDVLFVRGSYEDYIGRDPSVEEVLLIVEVSDTTIRQDRGRKAAKYARIGIAEYWIVNIASGQLEVYKEPIEDASNRWGYSYRSSVFYDGEQSASPLEADGQAVLVASLIPQRSV